MHIPFYYSFKDFEINYKNDFENWSKYFPDAIEKDYLFELKDLYAPFVRWSGKYLFEKIYRVSYIGETDYPEYGEVRTNELAVFVHEKLVDYCKKKGFIENVKVKNYIFPEYINPLDYWNYCNKNINRETVYFEGDYFNYLKYFFEYNSQGLHLNENKYKNFGFSVVKIAEWIDNKIKEYYPKKDNSKHPMNSEDTKNFLLGFFNNGFLNKNNIHSKEENQTIYDFFNKVKDEDLGETDVFKILKEYSADFNIDILKSILKDLDFYLFMERAEKESEFSPEDIDSAIEIRRKKGLDIPYFKKTPIENLTDKQIEVRKKIKENGFDIDAKVLDKENLLFPFEFYSLYNLKNIIITKVKSLSSKEINNVNPNETPKNDFSDIEENKIKNLYISDEIKKIANTVFSYDLNNVELLKYIANNFTGYRKDFTDLTKYNQIYFHFNSINNIPKEPYKNLIMEMFCFDYGKSEIKGINENHQTTIQRICTNFSKK